MKIKEQKYHQGFTQALSVPNFSQAWPFMPSLEHTDTYTHIHTNTHTHTHTHTHTQTLSGQLKLRIITLQNTIVGINCWIKKK